MYHDLRKRYWWTKMKIEIAQYVAKCDTCQRVKAIHMKTAGSITFIASSILEVGRYLYGLHSGVA